METTEFNEMEKWTKVENKRQKWNEEKKWLKWAISKANSRKTRKTQTKLGPSQTNGLHENMRIVQMAHWESDGKKYALDSDWDGCSQIETSIFSAFHIKFFGILCRFVSNVYVLFTLEIVYFHLSIDFPHIIAITIMSSHTLFCYLLYMCVCSARSINVSNVDWNVENVRFGLPSFS